MTYQVLNPGKQLVDGDVINDLANFVNYATVYGLTALAGGGRTGATQLVTGFNHIATCATVADSCVLPVATAGNACYVSNAGAASAQIFALGSDTVNATAGSTGVALAANTAAWFVCPQDGKWTAVGNNATLAAATITSATITTAAVTTLTVSGYEANSVATGLTAAGTTRADALQLAKQINNVTTAGLGTGVILPAVSTVGVGGKITIFNGGASPVQVYGSGSDTIDGVAATTGVPLTNAKRCDYYAIAATTWISAQLGVVSA